MTGIIAAISISDRKGIPKRNVPEADVRTDWGLDGDVHAGTRDRQVSLLALESIDAMRAKGASVSPGAFAENFTTEGIDLAALRVGNYLLIGEAVLVVTQIGKECHERCAIYFAAGDCVMPRDGIFARVVRGGRVRIGDTIETRTTVRLEAVVGE